MNNEINTKTHLILSKSFLILLLLWL